MNVAELVCWSVNNSYENYLVCEIFYMILKELRSSWGGLCSIVKDQGFAMREM